MPQQITMAFEEVVAEGKFNHLVVMPAAPVGKERDLATARFVNHSAGHGEFAISTLLADKNRVRGENHVFESFHRIDSLDFASTSLQNTTERIPLAACFHSVDYGCSSHIGVFLIDDIEIIRWTEQHLSHGNDGSAADEWSANTKRRRFGSECRLVGKNGRGREEK